MVKIYDVMKKQTAALINELSLEVLAVEACETVNKENGEIIEFVRVDVEVAKGQGAFSRCQFSVKIPDTKKVKVKQEELLEAEYQVFFCDLEISFVDTKGNVYFRATSYDVEREEE